MGNIELQITAKDWLGILLIGVVFSGFLSLLGYQIMGVSLYRGAVFGILLGFLITLFSLLFITGMNRYLLPKTDKMWWNSIAAVFSFLAGFLGSITTYFILHTLSFSMLTFFSAYPFQSATIIGILTYLMGALIYRFVKVRNEKEHLDTLFISSRVRSLETQLNPHFLFNALNSLAELIHQDPYKAEQAVLKMSTFLRNTMREDPLIPLDAELRNVDDYIELENIRFNGSIRLIKKADEQTYSRLIPKFSIQLLVENAIKHGFTTAQKDFTITITVTDDPRLQIRVTNSGSPIRKPDFAIGLSNLQERLIHLCQGDLIVEQFDPPTYLIDIKGCHEPIDRR